ncbi:MAG: hypothetical protein HN645_01025 [Gemmatimonadales bacterium]|nr:hypothetical protein [Gemmatimonadales bacterium]MBT6696184.1 hypothetical protein [Gemmatimonadales bacterium]MBT6889440.1 hypothetical protein [Gemmatimonadales bacterium]MBT7125009.1 hypothetical protein [Gemmatimonadales bacterium]MBT7501488.1 hypothetical protein [Gemmatimonadales bacterium]
MNFLSVFGATVDLEGMGSDPEDGSLTGSALTWSSDIDGALGSGASVSTTSLSGGMHVITLTATDSHGAQANATTQIGIRPPAPTLLSPTSGQVVDNGCVGWTDPKVWYFDWTDVAGSTTYQLYVIGPGATNPVINDSATDSEYQLSGTGYVIDSNRQGWRWRVRGYTRGVWGDWSEERLFDVEPLGTDCPAPALITPVSGAVLDNGCSVANDPIVWDFDWSDVAGADRYQLHVMGANASIPLINDATLTMSSHQFMGTGYIIESNRIGWMWQVRARVAGTWGSWSEVRVFDAEPLNTDCGG